MVNRTALVVAALLVAALSSVRWCVGQTLYSYLDDSGVRILTNIPPKAPVRDLKLTGPPPEPAVRPAAPASSRARAYDPIIEKYAGEYRLDPSLIRLMISKESGFNPKAVSPKGARGLMQLMPATAARHGVRDTLDPDENIRGGMRHMRTLLDTFDNDLALSLAAYNAGENLVQRIGRIPNIRETHDYVRTITEKYGKQTMSLQPEKPAAGPSMFRFADQNGIIHLTNIPPIQREEPETATAGVASAEAR